MGMIDYKRLIWCCVIVLAIEKASLGYCQPRDNGPFFEENLTAMVAMRSAEIKLKSLDRKANLILVISQSFASWIKKDSSVYYTIPAWIFVFRDPVDVAKTTCIEVRIQRDDRERLTINSRITDINFPKALTTHLKPITGWRIDSDQAEDRARKEGAFPADGFYMLKMGDVEGIHTPIWIIPYSYNDQLIRGVRADNGVFVYPLGKEVDKWTQAKPTH